MVRAIDILAENEIPYLLIGGASNLLFKNTVYDGVLVNTTKMRTKTVAENQIDVSCGVRIREVIRCMASLNFGGMEGLCSIPGTVGGMIKQNAGAYGYEISDLFTSASCYYPSIRKFVRLTKEDMRFAYRKSVLADTDAVLISAKFNFIETPQMDVMSKICEFQQKRVQSQPISAPSLGSIFKRHRGIGAGYYIDRCGLKGYRIGGACVSEKHAGFIINVGGATADDFLKVIAHIKNRVNAEFGIELEEEIEIIG